LSFFFTQTKWGHFGKLSAFSENSTNFTILKLLFKKIII
jgi:hypothetical protein